MEAGRSREASDRSRRPGRSPISSPVLWRCELRRPRGVRARGSPPAGPGDFSAHPSSRHVPVRGWHRTPHPTVRPWEATHPAAPWQVTGRRRQPAPLPPRLRGAGRLGCGKARVPLAVWLWEGGGEQSLSQGSRNGPFAAADGYKVAAERPVRTSVSRAAESARLLLPPPSPRRLSRPRASACALALAHLERRPGRGEEGGGAEP